MPGELGVLGDLGQAECLAVIGCRLGGPVGLPVSDAPINEQVGEDAIGQAECLCLCECRGGEGLAVGIAGEGLQGAELLEGVDGVGAGR